mgnify:FL=1
MFLSEAVSQVHVLVSGFGARGKIIENGMPCGELLRRLEGVLAIYEICNKIDSRGERKRQGFSVSVSGGIFCADKHGGSALVCNIMQQWLVQKKISERCIYVNRVSPNVEKSIRIFWKHLQSANIDNRTTVCVVSQTYHAIYLQQLLDFISQGKCLSMIRCCQYGSVRSMFSDMFQALFQYCSELVERRHFHQGKLKVAGGRTSL